MLDPDPVFIDFRIQTVFFARGSGSGSSPSGSTILLSCFLEENIILLRMKDTWISNLVGLRIRAEMIRIRPAIKTGSDRPEKNLSRPDHREKMIRENIETGSGSNLRKKA